MWMALARTQRGGHRREGRSCVEPESKLFFFLDKKHPFMKSSFSFYHIALQSALFGFHCLRHISQVPRGILIHTWLGTLTRDVPEECHHGLQLPLAFPECNQLLAATLSPENCNRF